MEKKEVLKKWLYSKEIPEGQLFNEDENPEDWVDSPAKLGNEIIEDLKIEEKPKKGKK